MLSLASVRRGRSLAVWSSALSSILALSSFLGCSAESGDPGGGTGANPGTGGVVGDGDGSGGMTNGDGDGDGDLGGDGDSTIDLGTGGTPEPMPGESEYCNDFAQTFVPQIPTVYVLVDHSSSMFEENFWEPMKQGVLNVVQALQSDVRFGFGSFTGITPQECPGLTDGPVIALDNYDAIAAAYDALPSWGPGDETETPTAQAIAQTVEILLADEAPGGKYILLVSDGEPDFCEDNLKECAADATIAALQHAYGQGIKTLVFGIENDGIADPELFDFFAQGGVGESPNWEDGLNVGAHNAFLADRCVPAADAQLWRDLRELMGNAPDPTMCGDNKAPEGNPDCYLPAGNYDPAGGTATAYLDPDPAVLAESILSEVESLKSCTFEFNFEVTDVSTGEIFVGDLNTPIPQDQWTMAAPNVLELTGAACEKWQSPEVFDFFAGFPCEAIVEIIR